ncbi:unnamed protein product [Oppiella nova]|uniref:Uncharacterized protein n=1 Tax=Oppiella nova TaxID=334625 RepID=A0A7R9QU53_9ACAR|nr:unnamed protein product [Oppiella nova]CAG2175624.1 unnamed protein product [Oppiella nova]
MAEPMARTDWDRFCQLIGFNGLKSSVRQEWDQKANGLSEELSALKASKYMIETEVKAMRDQIKDSKDMRVKDVKDVRQALVLLKALNETIICENKELTQELVSLNISCADSESKSDGNETQNDCEGQDFRDELNAIKISVEKVAMNASTDEVVNESTGSGDEVVNP